jgi:hypothetical protein
MRRAFQPEAITGELGSNYDRGQRDSSAAGAGGVIAASIQIEELATLSDSIPAMVGVFTAALIVIVVEIILAWYHRAVFIQSVSRHQHGDREQLNRYDRID